MTTADVPLSLRLTGQLPFIFLLSAVLALIVSLVLLQLYKRAVLRSMRSRGAGPAQADASPPVVTTSPVERVLDTQDGEVLFRRAARAPWRLAAIYVTAGCAYALVMAIAKLAGSHIEFSAHRLFLLAWCFAWPALLALTLIACPTWRTKAAALVPYLLVLGSGLLMGLQWQHVFSIWAFANLPATLLLVAFLARPIRAVGPLVFTFCLLGVTGALLALEVIAWDVFGGRSLTNAAFDAGLNARGVLVVVLLLGFAAFAVAGWRALRWLGKRYEGKRMSDLSLTLDAIWINFAAVHSMFLALNGPAWALCGPAAFLVYKIVIWLGFRVSGVGATPPASASPRLLVLRVFSLGRRSERMFARIAARWRHVGSMQLIAGPDLATSTVEPHEFLDFVGGKLSRRFIDSAARFEQRLVEMDLAPDIDGRFRVNDFFCQDDTWQTVLTRLVQSTDAVLMDLRGFSRANAGCTFEIQELMRRARPESLLFLVDRTTDEAFLEDTIRAAAGSPNVTRNDRCFFRVTGRAGELRALIRALCAAVAGRPLAVG